MESNQIAYPTTRKNTLIDVAYALFNIIIFSLLFAILVPAVFEYLPSFVYKFTHRPAFSQVYRNDFPNAIMYIWFVISIIYLLVSMLRRRGVLKILLPISIIISAILFINTYLGNYRAIYLTGGTSKTLYWINCAVIIPITMLLSFIILGKSSKWFSIIFAIMIVGILVYLGYNGHQQLLETLRPPQ